MNCPGCGAALHQMVYEGIAVDSCANCKGEWLDSDELKKVTQLREAKFDAEERRAVAEAASLQGIPAADHARLLKCPKCDELLSPMNYGGGSGLILDKCASCGGFWLDDSELEKVQMIVEGWDDALDDDLARYSGRLHDVSLASHALDGTSSVSHSRLPMFGRFINACVNGVLNLVD